MKWPIILGAALAFLVVVVAIIGATLPQNHVASRSMRFAKPPPQIFAAVEKLTG